MNRIEVIHFLNLFFASLKSKTPVTVDIKPFLDLVLSLKHAPALSIPLLRDIAAFNTDKETGLLKRKIDRRYRRLCRAQEELGRLDFRKAAPGASPEDYIFSRIDFSRYRQIPEKDFELFSPEALTDFDGYFSRKNFGLDLDRAKIQSVIEGSYKKTDGVYNLRKENPLILSIMRTLETSLETLPLFSAEEIKAEIKNLLDFAGGSGWKSREKIEPFPDMEKLFCVLLRRFDNELVSHNDTMTTRLFISPKGDLSGTFRPAGKPWTLVLVPAEQVNGAGTVLPTLPYLQNGR